MSKEGSVRNFLGIVDVFAVGCPLSLDSRNGGALRSLYYEMDEGSPYESVDCDQPPLLISDQRTIFQTDPVVFSLYNLKRLTLPGAQTLIEKLVNPFVGEEGSSYQAQLVPELGKSQVDQINSLDDKTKFAVLSDLSTYYPKFVITQGNIFEGYLGDDQAFIDSPVFEHIPEIEGFTTPLTEEIGGRSIWKIAKEYPQKKSYETIVLSFGLNYSLTDNDPGVMTARADEFIKAVEVGGQDARTMIGRLATPSIQIRRKSLYDMDNSRD